MAKRFSEHQVDSLKIAFDESDHLTKQRKLDLVSVTGLDMEQIASWFNRKRARKREKKTMGELERINSELRQLLQDGQERETKLQKELQECKRREAELEEENERLKCRLTVEGDIQYDSLMEFDKLASFFDSEERIGSFEQILSIRDQTKNF